MSPLAFALFDGSTLAGLLAPVFFLIAVGFGAWAYSRVHISKAQELAITTWRQNYEAQEERAELAERRADDNLARYEAERDVKHALQTDLATEKLKTDQTVVLAEIVQFHKDFADREVLFHKLLETLETGRDAIALQIKTMETRLVGLMGEQTKALKQITETIVNGNGEQH